MRRVYNNSLLQCFHGRRQAQNEAYLKDKTTGSLGRKSLEVGVVAEFVDEFLDHVVAEQIMLLKPKKNKSR